MGIVLSHYVYICHPATKLPQWATSAVPKCTENIFKECEKIKYILSTNIALTKVYLN